MRIGIIGRTESLLNTIPFMMESGHDIAFIITCKAQPEYSKNENDFQDIAKRFSVPFLSTEKINSQETVKWIHELNADIGLSVNWKTLIKKNVRDCFKYGIINAHPGDLPRYRGNAVANWAIIQGEKKIVLTLHFMDDGLDSGDILLKEEIKINEHTKIKYVVDTLNSITPRLFLTAINEILNGTIKPKNQTNYTHKVLRCLPRMPFDSEINWKKSAINIDRLIRASSEPYSGAYSFFGLQKIIIWKAHYEKSQINLLGIPGQVVEIRYDTEEVSVLAGKDLIILEEIQLDNSNKTKPTNVITSVRIRLGMDVSNNILDISKKLSEIQKMLTTETLDTEKNVFS